MLFLKRKHQLSVTVLLDVYSKGLENLMLRTLEFLRNSDSNNIKNTDDKKLFLVFLISKFLMLHIFEWSTSENKIFYFVKFQHFAPPSFGSVGGVLESPEKALLLWQDLADVVSTVTLFKSEAATLVASYTLTSSPP